MLLFHVEDVLGIAQLKSGKFRKNVTRFNIKKAVDDIVEIQQYSADQKNINIDVRFMNKRLTSDLSPIIRKFSSI